MMPKSGLVLLVSGLFFMALGGLEKILLYMKLSAFTSDYSF